MNRVFEAKLSQIVKTRLTKTMNKPMKFCKLRVIFQTNNRLKNYFRFKDSVLQTLFCTKFSQTAWNWWKYKHPKSCNYILRTQKITVNSIWGMVFFGPQCTYSHHKAYLIHCQFNNFFTSLITFFPPGIKGL